MISNPIRLSKNGSISASGGLDPALTRFFLLFWDKFDWPDNAFISIGGPDEHIDFLIEAGVIKRSIAHGSISGSGAEILKFCHIGAFDQLDRLHPGQWSLAKGEGSFSFEDSNLHHGRGMLVELHQAIPIPSEEVPYQEILEFKLKRRDELTQLRVHLGELYQAIMSSPDIELSKTTQLQKLDQAIADHVRTISETGFALRLSGLKANLNVPSAIAGLLTSIASAQSDLPFSSALLNGALATLTVSAGAELLHRRPSNTPYQYVGSIHKHFVN